MSIEYAQAIEEMEEKQFIYGVGGANSVKVKMIHPIMQIELGGSCNTVIGFLHVPFPINIMQTKEDECIVFIHTQSGMPVQSMHTTQQHYIITTDYLLITNYGNIFIGNFP